MRSSRISLLEWAISYAELGWYVLPLKEPISASITPCIECPGHNVCTAPGKHPMDGLGAEQASVDLGQVSSWWHKWPDANIGIAVGRGQGPTVVIDVDRQHALKWEENRLIAGIVRRVRTPAAHTGGGPGHCHYYFRNDMSGTSIETRGLKYVDVLRVGWIVAPPSRHASWSTYSHKQTLYRWWRHRSPLGLPLGQLPSELLSTEG